MALFTDGPPADIEYLRSYESSILSVAETEAIDLDAKLMLAAAEIGDIVLRFLLNEGTREGQIERRRLGIKGIVVTPSLRRWHAVRTLEAVYRDAYGGQLNERYAAKMKQYSEFARQAAAEYFQIGVGLVSNPVSRPNPPVAVSVGETSGESMHFSATWVDRQGRESAPSNTVMIGLSAGTALELVSAPDPAAIGWNLYAGTSAGSLTLQCSSPLPLGAAWTFTGSLRTDGAWAGAGQSPDYFVAHHQSNLRG